MVWSAIIQMTVILVFSLLFLGMARLIMPRGLKVFFAKHWSFFAPVMWSLTFILTLAIADIISSLIVATAIWIAGSISTKFTLWMERQRSQLEIKKPSPTFRSARSFYQD